MGVHRNLHQAVEDIVDLGKAVDHMAVDSHHRLKCVLDM